MLVRELDIGILSRMLVLSGEGRLLSRILPDELEESSRLEVEEASASRAKFNVATHEWVGRIDRVRLPSPIRIGERVVRWFSVRHGVNPGLIERLARHGHREELPDFLGQRARLVHAGEAAGRDGGDTYAVIRWGDSFVSDISLH